MIDKRDKLDGYRWVQSLRIARQEKMKKEEEEKSKQK